MEGRTVRPLGDENDKGFALINALDDKQQSQAILNYRVADLVLGATQDGKTIQPEGIRASALSAAQQAKLWDIVREWSGISADAYADARHDRVEVTPQRHVFRVEWSNDERQRDVLPDPGADAGDRIRAAEERRSHPHDLSGSDQRLRGEDCEASPLTELRWLRLALTASLCPASGGALRMRFAAIVATAMLVCATVELSAHRRDELLQAARIGIANHRVEIELSLTPGIDVADSVIAAIDSDRDGAVSAGEQRVYLRDLIAAISLSVDGKPLTFGKHRDFPDLQDLRGGNRSIEVRSIVPLPPLADGRHQLSFNNRPSPGHQRLSCQCAEA